MGTGVSVTAQYSVNEEINYNDAIKSGFMAPYTLNAPIGIAVLISSFAGELINQWNKELEKEGEK